MKTSRQPHPTLIFDGECPFCRKWVRRLQGILHDERVTFRSLTEESVRVDFPGISKESLMQAIHFVTEDGTVQAGVDAIVAALSLRPAGKLSRALRLPGLRQVSDAAYRTVAARRFREELEEEGCGTAKCDAHDSNARS